MKTRLHPKMSEAEFDNGYWYATQIKDFAKSLGLGSTAKLRKDELEKAIKHFLRTGKVEVPTSRSLQKSGVRDIDRGLSLSLAVVNYTSNKVTKSFLMREALKMSPGLKKKSGARYRLNRWREEQLTLGRKITYRDLVKKYVEFNRTEKAFTKIASTRYINFLSEFLSKEKNATRAQALKAWHQLKNLEVPKNYLSWKKYQKLKGR